MPGPPRRSYETPAASSRSQMRQPRPLVAVPTHSDMRPQSRRPRKRTVARRLSYAPSCRIPVDPAVARAHAQAAFLGPAFADASADARVVGDPTAGSLRAFRREAVFDNSGSIFVHATGIASGLRPDVSATATGVSQVATALGSGGIATAKVVNSGTLRVSSLAVAKPKSASATHAVASATSAVGVGQVAAGPRAPASPTSPIRARSTPGGYAQAAGRQAEAGAGAIGAVQVLAGSPSASATARFRNSGAILARASASAKGAIGSGGAASASATAFGLKVFAVPCRRRSSSTSSTMAGSRCLRRREPRAPIRATITRTPAPQASASCPKPLPDRS